MVAGAGVSPPAGTGAFSASGPRFSLPVRRVWELPGGGSLDLEGPVVMGVVNLTPDSFSDGGELPDLATALERARRMVREGAQIVDVGGESTRPGAPPVPPERELGRILGFVEAASAELPVPVSVDTRKARVARAAVAAGASIVNDVSGFRHDPRMAGTVAELGVATVLMHMRGEPADMQERTAYGDLVGEIRRELAESVSAAREAGVAEERIVVDPGIGFAKTADQNLELLRGLDGLLELGYPVMVGPSRKSFLGAVLGVPPKERAVGTAAACVLAYLGGARIFRVHDVEPVVQALRVTRAVERGTSTR